MDISCIILAGGKSLRLGRAKALETVGKRSLLQWVLFRLSLFNSDVLIITSAEQPFTQFAGNPRLKIITDTYPGTGPLGGIYTGLAASDSFYNLVIACDMLFLNQGLLRYMIQLSADFDLVIPRLGKLVEPLHAVYSKNCLAPIESLLKRGNLQVSQLCTLVRVRYVKTREINRFSTDHLSFFNINTEADLEKARELIKET